MRKKSRKNTFFSSLLSNEFCEEQANCSFSIDFINRRGGLSLSHFTLVS